MFRKFFLSLIACIIAVSATAAGRSHLTPRQEMNGLWGYVNASGNVMIKPRYDDARDFREGRAAVEQRGKWGYIDEQGKTIVKCQYGSATDFNGGYGIVTDKKTGLYGAVNKDGDLIVPCEHPRMEDLQNVLLIVIKKK